ncbi:hypothetical protein [Enterobacter hormaechei]|uniref:hypothetical protein n=1 Tax=Enterobacter hormaechei TaxID=158836 RepID=UPI00079C4674|nr:hypothetical protein [Enterobacter hormaechei]SAD71294.1 Uncharacterised protein [Enterobacter hormaechei]SAG59613.1 Uncharacterised protein [Enterobacter hormaechei]SAI02662.1 Uncharacterised protein [Enterobacter hormaechei]
MSQAIVSQGAAFTAQDVEQLLNVIGSVSDTAYSRVFLKQHGFDTSTSWELTRKNIGEQLAGKRKGTSKTTYSNLEKIAKGLMLLGKHYCEIFSISAREHDEIIKRADSFSFNGKPYSDVFPFFVEENLLTTASMPVITSVEKNNSGVIFYFSTPRRVLEKVKSTENVGGKLRSVTYFKEAKKQYIDSVFVPFDHKRAEFRISAAISKRDIETEMSRLQDVFVTTLALNKIKLKDTHSVNINKAIAKIYDDASLGRVVETVFHSLDNGINIPRSCRKDIGVCLRNQEYHLAGAEKEDVECVAVCVRWDSTVKDINIKVKTELKLESLAHFNYTVSKRFEIENPRGFKHAISLISEIEKAL